MSKRILCAILYFIPICVFADYNGIGFKMALGYNDAISLPTKKDNGLASAFNFIYEYNNQHFLSQTGVGIHYSYFNIQMPPYQDVLLNMIDEDGDVCRYGYLFSARQDNAHILTLDIPILVGGKWNIFYFLIGGKVQYSLMGRFKEQANLTTWGEYHNLIDYLENMPNHNFINQVGISSRQQYLLPLAICASAEIGIDLSTLLQYHPQTHNKNISRIAVFAECTVNNLSPSSEKTLYNFHLHGNKISQFQISDVTMQHCYKAKDSNISALRFWEIGVRYTLLFTIPMKNKTCHCVKR